MGCEGENYVEPGQKRSLKLIWEHDNKALISIKREFIQYLSD
jgi:hypothetical protein